MPNPDWFVYMTPLLGGWDGDTVDVVQRFTRRFKVIVNTPNITESQICTAPGLPRPFGSFVDYKTGAASLLALCVKMRAAREHEDDYSSWIVTAEWSTEMPPGGPQYGNNMPDNAVGVQSNPELVPPQLSWDHEIDHKAQMVDLDGNPYLNSAGMPFTPAPQDDTAYHVLVIERNELSWSRANAQKWSFSVNSDIFLGAPPGTAQSTPPKAKQDYFGRKMFWKVIYRIRFKPDTVIPGLGGLVGGVVKDDIDTWQATYLDQGLYQKAGQGTGIGGAAAHIYFHQPVPILRFGHQVSQPVLLDGNGRPAKPGPDGKIPPTWLKFRNRQSITFNDIFSNIDYYLSGIPFPGG